MTDLDLSRVSREALEALALDCISGGSSKLDAVITRIRAEATVEPDIKKREPGCECHLEEGDSPCVVHGVYEPEKPPLRTRAEVDTARSVRECALAWDGA